jgi:hypothetical protein
MIIIKLEVMIIEYSSFDLHIRENCFENRLIRHHHIVTQKYLIDTNISNNIGINESLNQPILINIIPNKSLKFLSMDSL